MEVKELGHLVLYVSDLSRSAAFYRDVLGWNQLTPPRDESVLSYPAVAFAAPTGRTHHALRLVEADRKSCG